MENFNTQPALRSSGEIGDITAARIKLRAQIKNIALTGDDRGRVYADIEDYINAITPHLEENGLLFEQHPVTEQSGLCLVSRISHISGQWVESSFCIPDVVSAEFGKNRPKKDDPNQELRWNKGINALQELGSDITYMRKYAISAIFFIRGDKDTDGNKNVEQGSKTSSSYSQPYQKKTITDKQRKMLVARLSEKPNDVTGRMVEKFNISTLESIPMSQFNEILAWLDTQ